MTPPKGFNNSKQTAGSMKKPLGKGKKGERSRSRERVKKLAGTGPKRLRSKSPVGKTVKKTVKPAVSFAPAAAKHNKSSLQKANRSRSRRRQNRNDADFGKNSSAYAGYISGHNVMAGDGYRKVLEMLSDAHNKNWRARGNKSMVIDGDIYSKKEANEIMRLTGKAPEHLSILTAPNTIYVDNVANPCLWQNVFSSIIIATHAKFPNVEPPTFFGQTPSWSGLMAYYWWAMISKFQEQGIGVLQEVNSAFPVRGTVVPAFPKDARLPTGVAKFIESFLPSIDKRTGGKIQYLFGWTGPLSVTKNHLTPTAPQTDYSYCPFGQMLVLANNTSPLPNEINFIQQNAAWTIDNIFQNPEAFSTYVSFTAVFCDYGDIPDGCSMATQAAIWIPSQTKLLSPAPNFDEDLVVAFHGPYQGDTSVTPTYRFESCVPTSDCNIPTQYDGGGKLQLSLALTYGFLSVTSKYVRGGLKHYLKNNHFYPGLKTLMPKYFNLDLAAWHCVQAQAMSAFTSMTDGSLDNEALYTVLTCWESCLLSRIMPYAYLGFAYYGRDNTGQNEIVDFASLCTTSGSFRALAIPPPLLDWLENIGPCVDQGRLVVPLIDCVSPTAPFTYVGGNPIITAGTLPAGTSQWSGRWVGISSLTASIPNGNFQTYAEQGASQTYQQATGYFQFPISSSLNIFSVANATISQAGLGVSLSINAPVYPGSTPIKTAMMFIAQYQAIVQPVSATFNTAREQILGNHAVLTCITRTNLYNNVSFNVAPPDSAFLFIQPVSAAVGSYIAMDSTMAARALFYGYRTTPLDLSYYPYRVSFPQDTDLSGALINYTLQDETPTAYLERYNAALAKGDTPSLALTAALSQFYATIFPNELLGPPISHKEAMMRIIKSIKGSVCSPYNQPDDTDLTESNSWSDVTHFFKTAWHFTETKVLPAIEKAAPIISAILSIL